MRILAGRLMAAFEVDFVVAGEEAVALGLAGSKIGVEMIGEEFARFKHRQIGRQAYRLGAARVEMASLQWQNAF